MTPQLIIGFVTEGSTDYRFLESIIQRTFEDVAFDCDGEIEILPVQYFEKSGLKNAALITSTASQQLANGSINYLEWVQVINQAITVKSDYIEAVKNLNDSIILLHYFTNK